MSEKLTPEQQREANVRFYGTDRGPLTDYAQATMEEIGRRLNLPAAPVVTRETRLMGSVVEACEWLRSGCDGAPGRALAVLEQALADCRRLP